MQWFLAEVDCRPEGSAPGSNPRGTVHAVFSVLAQMRRDYWQEVKGNDDDVTSGEALLRESQPNKRRDVATFVAVEGSPWANAEPGPNGLPLIGNATALNPSRVVGRVSPAIPLLANQHLMGLGWGVYVHPKCRGAGIGSALLQQAELWAQKHGTSSFLVASIGVAVQGEPAIRIRSDEIGLQPDGATRFCEKHGYQPTQIVRHQVLNLGQTGPQIAQHPAPGYELQTYLGETPGALRDGRIQLRMDLEADVPRGAEGPGVTPWSEERLRDFETKESLIGDNLTTMALDSKNQKPVGFTRLLRPFDNPRVAFQKETVVTQDHRGHGLGLAMKAANLAMATDLWPEIRRINTWTAAENLHMVWINEQLGFRTMSAEANWMKNVAG